MYTVQQNEPIITSVTVFHLCGGQFVLEELNVAKQTVMLWLQ